MGSSRMVNVAMKVNLESGLRIAQMVEQSPGKQNIPGLSHGPFEIFPF